MNIRFVLKLVGRIELIVAATMCLPLAVALLYGESPLPFLCSQAVMLCICLPLACLPAQPTFFQREGFATVGLIWIVTCLFGSLPFCFSGCFASFLDCLFEASSGFSTTGGTILPDIENNIPDSPKLSRQALWAYSAGIITGKTDGSFDPQGVMTRAEMCAVFCRLMEYTPRVQVVVQEVPQSDYFITTGDRKGMLKEEVGREYGKKALAGMFIGEDANGVYFSATAPVLPAEMQHCTVDYDVFVERPNGDFFVDHVGPSLTSGQSVKVYFNTFSNTPLRSSQIGSMRIYVGIHVPDYEDTITYLTDTSTSSQVLEIRTEPEGDYSTKIDLDVSHIFKGIGK